MADVQRTRSAILTLFQDNVTGQISAQDLRDFVVTVMEPENANPGDFWSKPQAKYTTTDKSARGFRMYSQYVGSDCSFMNVMFMEASTGYWMRADATGSTRNGLLGLAMDSYTSDVSTAEILIEGVVYNSAFSTYFSELIGRPIWLGSVTSVGSINWSGAGNCEYIIGFVVPSDDHGGSAIGKFYFAPGKWGISGT